MVRFALAGLFTVWLGVVAAREPVTFRSPYGFQFQVPAGWRALPVSGQESTVVIIPDPPTPASQTEGFAVRTCSRPDPQSCLEPGFTATLVETTNTRLGGLPANQYTYERWTTSETRRWWDVVTMVTQGGQTYAVVGSFPTLDATRDWVLYNQIRRSFRITAKASTGAA
jgi:predicted Zn-dependent protease